MFHSAIRTELCEVPHPQSPGAGMNPNPTVVRLRGAAYVLDVAYIPGRGFHGIKRRHVTAALRVSRGDVDLVGDVTGNRDREVLLKVYCQEECGPEDRHVLAMRGHLKGLGTSDGLPEEATAGAAP